MRGSKRQQEDARVAFAGEAARAWSESRTVSHSHTSTGSTAQLLRGWARARSPAFWRLHADSHGDPVGALESLPAARDAAAPRPGSSEWTAEAVRVLVVHQIDP